MHSIACAPRERSTSSGAATRSASSSSRSRPRSQLVGPDQARWLDRLEDEFDNLRSTLDWCLLSGRVEDALRAISALERFWRGHAHVSEARRWLAHGLAFADDVPAEIRADALRTAAQQAAAQSDWAEAGQMLEQARDAVSLGWQRA